MPRDVRPVRDSGFYVRCSCGREIYVNWNNMWDVCRPCRDYGLFVRCPCGKDVFVNNKDLPDI